MVLQAAPTHAQNVPSYVPAAGLAAWYSFSGNAADGSGNGNAATSYGPTLTTDRFGNANGAYRFNGTSDYMQVVTGASSSLNLRNSGSTVAVWFKSNWKTVAQDMQLFYRGDAQYATDPYLLYLSNGSAVYRRDVGTGQTVNTVSTSLASADTGLFHHLVGTYDSASGKMTLYLDGAQINQMTLPGTLSYATNAFTCYIGSADNGQQLFKGVLDDIGVWNRALTACEIAQLYYASTMITQQPVTGSVSAGGSVSFSIQDINSATATYQWQVNAGSGFTNLTNTPPYTGATTKVLTINPATAGLNGYQYRCVRTSGTCVDYSAAAPLRVAGAGSVGTAGGPVALALYPNPGSGHVVLRSALPAGTDCRLTATDAAGRVLLQQQLRLASQETSLDLGALAPGVYALTLSYGSEKQTVLFSKTH